MWVYIRNVTTDPPPAHHRQTTFDHAPANHPPTPACQVLDAAGKLNCGKATADEQRLMAMGNALRSKGNGKAKGGGVGGSGGGGGADSGGGGGGGAANGANGAAGGAGGREGAGRQMQQISSKKENTAVRRAVSAGRVDEALASFNQLRDKGGNIDVTTVQYLLSLLVKTGRFAACSPIIECVPMPPPGETMTPQAAAMLPASFISKLLSEVRSQLWWWHGTALAWFFLPRL